MKIACLCPTFRRPQLAANAAACFLAQDYPSGDRRLYVLDDAKQFEDTRDEAAGIYAASTQARYASLANKFNAVALWALSTWPEVEAFAVWEDDDVYLSGHLRQHAVALAGGAGCSMPSRVLSNYGLPKDGSTRVEDATGRFHGGWAFSRAAFERIGGWPDTQRLDFDQRFGAALRQCGAADPCEHGGPSYVYRWGNGLYHGSQWGECDDWVERVGRLPLPAEPVGPLLPRMDAETAAIYAAQAAAGGAVAGEADLDRPARAA